jgi:hypothetical protein
MKVKAIAIKYGMILKQRSFLRLDIPFLD